MKRLTGTVVMLALLLVIVCVSALAQPGSTQPDQEERVRRSLQQARTDCLGLFRNPEGVLFTIPYNASPSDKICWQTFGDSVVCLTVREFRDRSRERKP